MVLTQNHGDGYTYIMNDFNNQSIQLIALDIDGTLVNDKKEFPSDFDQTMEALIQKGIHVVIASGRSYMALKRDFGKYLNNFVLLAENGGYAAYRGQTIACHHLDKENIRKVTDALKPLGVPSVMSGLEKGYVLSHANDQFFDHIKVYYDAIQLDSIDQLNDDVFKVSAFDWVNARDKIYEPLAYFGTTMDVVVAGDQWVDFNPKGINKGNTLKEVMTYFGLTSDQCMAFGDQDNDITMIQSVKYGFAMKNATDSLKSVAWKITSNDNNHNGALDTIHSLLNI